MIPFHKLRCTPQSSEVVYQWEAEDGHTRMWAIERLEKWLKTSDKKIYKAEIDKSRLQMYVEERGIERHRIAYLLENQHLLQNPTIMMRLGVPPAKIMDLMLDGHHRYFTLGMMGFEYFLTYHITEEEASSFEVYGHPQLSGEILTTMFSGIIPK